MAQQVACVFVYCSQISFNKEEKVKLGLIDLTGSLIMEHNDCLKMALSWSWDFCFINKSH